MDKRLIEVPATTLDFYTYEEDGLVFYEFDATECDPPEPMVNTMRGLGLLKNYNERLVGIYFHEPFPLYERIPISFEHEAIEMENGDFKVIFKKSKDFLD
ncbi:MAG: DUF2249 domain-containing protein [Epsilonproteobacteria bacterium]|nr:DUF2249 domain-containing protein [Campylobacterota bacterium]